MRRLYSFIIILTIGIAAGTAGSVWYSRPSETMAATAVVDPSAPAKAERKILYYRNPMGAPDTSPVPKKDPMGMDYIPVYAAEHESEGTVKVSLDKIQRTGVKTEKVVARPVGRSVRAVGRVEHDEALLTIVTVRSDGYIEELFVNKTGQHVKEGEPLFRFYSSQIQLAQSDLIVAMRTEGRKTGPEADKKSRRCHVAVVEPWGPAEPHRRGAKDQHQSKNHRLASTRDWRCDREENHQWPAGDGR